MSKIGRKPIKFGAIKVEIKGNEIHFKGSKKSGVHILPAVLTARIEDSNLFVVGQKEETMSAKELRDVNRVWGLHRALLANEIKGAAEEFESLLEINGLGYKAVVAGKKVSFTLGYSHKIDMNVPEGVTLEVDKSGQKLKVKSSDKFSLGRFCSAIKALKLPEPYKGKGIKLAHEEIIRKAAKGKAGGAAK